MSTAGLLRRAVFDAGVDYFLEPIREFLNDESVTEIMVNGYDRIYVERRGRLEETTAQFDGDDALLSAVHNIAQWVGREVGPQRPILDARLPGGARVHAVLPPASLHGICLTIRKFSRRFLELGDLVAAGSLSAQAREFLELCVRLRKNILISGGTGTGKTTLLNAVSAAIPEGERIIVIEDTSELKLHQRHCIYLENRTPDARGREGLTLRQLFTASLRMRPDRIIMGEVRSGEALDMVQAMISGHAGSLSTVHADTPRDALVRLETLSLMSGIEIPLYVARSQVAAAIHLIVQIARFTEDGSRKITRISEVCGLDDRNQYVLQDIFTSRYHGKSKDGAVNVELIAAGRAPMFHEELHQQGLGEHARLTGDLWPE